MLDCNCKGDGKTCSCEKRIHEHCIYCGSLCFFQDSVFTKAFNIHLEEQEISIYDTRDYWLAYLGSEYLKINWNKRDKYSQQIEQLTRRGRVIYTALKRLGIGID